MRDEMTRVAARGLFGPGERARPWARSTAGKTRVNARVEAARRSLVGDASARPETGPGPPAGLLDSGL